MTTKIGIPRALAYFTFFPLWITFFEQLNMDVMVSSESNKQVLDQGVKETVNDACIPIKIYHGHVKDLTGKVDYLFVPRLVSLDGEETVCPKFLGLPDMVRYSIEGLPPLIDERLDLRKGRFELWKFFYRIGRTFNKGFLEIFKAYQVACREYQKYRNLLTQGFTPQNAWEALRGEKNLDSNNNKTQSEDISIALLGYPYTIYDSYISVGLFERLKNMGVNVLTKDNVPPQELLKQRKNFSKEMFWYYSNQVARAALYYLDKPRVNGVIHVTAFGCGPDAMVDKLVELECKQNGVPFLTLSLDEHTGEAGVGTRVEAFVDMLKRKRGL
ncbi:acyl-CoA dehydratase activase-related protein [Natranaerobius thermophilus]|uniref:DUF2229 domain-containing protein n=1 Tax=Natranaerobius thermophilus (strain ATCC BAA-1301 / DSM 18059 / JW/NM-WN-LF) TaxID=457570 RepID=B2A3T2_NATTJ|nr:acyl-CoA dehydratase activase-related protein [Natranaerobius thermophilus]ACB83708.1 conserved hypothetical protein [Natranaerobius thermophilus JW/NM-WN-LF]